ncbi:MAG: hypothetical protein WBS54_07345 [Acidobacteriota bacterium]
MLVRDSRRDRRLYGRRGARRSRLTGPWRNVHGAVWLVGLALLAWTGWWWPGILVLVAASMVVEALIMMLSPQSVAAQDTSAAPALQPQPAPSPIPPPQAPRIDLLPSTCPKCAGPIHGKDVIWTSPRSADCPYCGTSLPMRKE